MRQVFNRFEYKKLNSTYFIDIGDTDKMVNLFRITNCNMKNRFQIIKLKWDRGV